MTLSIDTSAIVNGLANDATPVANAFTATQNEVNALTNSNIASGAAIAVSKLAPGTNGQVLTTTGGVAAWGTAGPSVYFRAAQASDMAGATFDIVSTASETTMFTKTITGGDMSTNKLLRLTAIGDYLNNTGAGRTFEMKVKFGGTTIYDETSSSITAYSDRRPWRLQLELGNLGSASSQFMTGQLRLGSAPAAGVGPATGIGVITDATTAGANTEMLGVFSSNGTHSIATSSNQDLVVTIQHSTNSASLSWRLRYAILEIL